MIIPTPILILFSLSEGIFGQSFWSQLDAGKVDQNQGWQENQMMATNTTTPAYDPNTSTPGSTMGLESVTQPSERRKYDMRGRPNKTESAMKTLLDSITADANTASISKSSQKTIVPVQYIPVGETSVDSPIVVDAQVKYDSQPTIVEIAHTSPYGIPITFKHTSITGPLKMASSVASGKSASLSEPLPGNYNGIPVLMGQGHTSGSEASTPKTVDSNIDTITFNVIMEPVAEFKSSHSLKPFFTADTVSLERNAQETVVKKQEKSSTPEVPVQIPDIYITPLESNIKSSNADVGSKSSQMENVAFGKGSIDSTNSVSTSAAAHFPQNDLVHPPSTTLEKKGTKSEVNVADQRTSTGTGSKQSTDTWSNSGAHTTDSIDVGTDKSISNTADKTGGSFVAKLPNVEIDATKGTGEKLAPSNLVNATDKTDYTTSINTSVIDTVAMEPTDSNMGPAIASIGVNETREQLTGPANTSLSESERTLTEKTTKDRTETDTKTINGVRSSSTMVKKGELVETMEGSTAKQQLDTATTETASNIPTESTKQEQSATSPVAAVTEQTTDIVGSEKRTTEPTVLQGGKMIPESTVGTTQNIAVYTAMSLGTTSDPTVGIDTSTIVPDQAVTEVVTSDVTTRMTGTHASTIISTGDMVFQTQERTTTDANINVARESVNTAAMEQLEPAVMKTETDMSIGKQTTSSVIVGLPSESGLTADSGTSSFTAEQQTGHVRTNVFVSEEGKLVPESTVGTVDTVISLTTKSDTKVGTESTTTVTDQAKEKLPSDVAMTEPQASTGLSTGDLANQTAVKMLPDVDIKVTKQSFGTATVDLAGKKTETELKDAKHASSASTTDATDTILATILTDADRNKVDKMVTGMMSTGESTTRFDNAAVLYTDKATVDGRGDITSKINVDISSNKTAETISSNDTDVQSTELKIKSSSKGTTIEKQLDLIESTSTGNVSGSPYFTNDQIDFNITLSETGDVALNLPMLSDVIVKPPAVQTFPDLISNQTDITNTSDVAHDPQLSTDGGLASVASPGGLVIGTAFDAYFQDSTVQDSPIITKTTESAKDTLLPTTEKNVILESIDRAKDQPYIDVSHDATQSELLRNTLEKSSHQSEQHISTDGVEPIAPVVEGTPPLLPSETRGLQQNIYSPKAAKLSKTSELKDAQTESTFKSAGGLVVDFDTSFTTAGLQKTKKQPDSVVTDNIPAFAYNSDKQTKQDITVFSPGSGKSARSEKTEQTTTATEPTLKITDPSTTLTEKAIETTEPVIKTTEPARTTTEPATTTTEPVTTTTEPVTTTTEPTTTTKEPVTTTTEPTTTTTETTTTTTEPTTTTTEPTTTTTKPTTTTTEPTTTTTEPTTTTTEPTTTTTEPTTTTTEPTTTTTEPTTTTVELTTTTEATTTTTEPTTTTTEPTTTTVKLTTTTEAATTTMELTTTTKATARILAKIEAQDPTIPKEFTLTSLCTHLEFVDGSGYKEYPGSCQKYVQCSESGGTIYANLRECASGYFWHQGHSSCRQPVEVPCFDDPCLGIDVLHYNRSGCRGFYSCEFGISVPECCDKGFRYDGIKCVEDATCVDPCMTPYELENQLKYGSCKTLPDQYNNYGYLMMEHGRLQFRTCPEGTIYRHGLCGCDTAPTTFRRGRRFMGRRLKDCKPDFYMNFDHGFKELSGSNMAFDVSNVHINDGAAQFDGNAKLTLWGFMNKELGKKFAIRLRFKPDPTSTGRGSIISNCGMTGSPTVSIALENHQLKFSAKSMSFRRPKVIKDHFDPYSWNDVMYFYDGTNFVVQTNGFKTQKPLGGLLETRSNALVIGGCPRPETGFKGLIDSIEVYSGCFPRNIFKARRNPGLY